jgi:N-carbamoylputrescine amidase
MSADTIPIGVVQMSCGPDPNQNLEKAVERVREAARRGAKIVCLQELLRSQYFCQTEDTRNYELAEPIPGPSTETLGRVAREQGIVIVSSLFEKRAEGVFHNTAAVLDADGEIAGCYRKMHIPDDPLYYEKFYFTPGDLGFRSFATRHARTGVLVCWDQWFPEAARLTALTGAEILFYPTAIGWHPSEKAQYGAAQHSAWETMQRAHAIANGCYVAVPNRVGVEGGLEFWGGSFIADPFGEILAKASHDREEILVAECRRERIAFVRRNWPFLRDRRIDAYDGLLKRYLD